MRHTFVPKQTVQYVLRSNVLECVGTQQLAATQEALRQQLEMDGAIDFLCTVETGVTNSSDPASEPAYLPDLPKKEVDAMTPDEQREHAICETRQTLTAMHALRKLHDDNVDRINAEMVQQVKWDTKEHRPVRLEYAHMLDSDDLLAVHKKLMAGLLSKHSKTEKGTPVQPGVLRDKQVMAGSVLFSNYLHLYLPPTHVPGALFNLLDAYKYYCAEMPSIDEPALRIELCFKMAAKLLYEFISIHPFTNGNGRMARLLACRALAPICPFPVPIQPIVKPNQIVRLPVTVIGQLKPDGLADTFDVTLHDARSVYIAAIEAARFHVSGKAEPTLLAAMLIENAYQLWSTAFREMSQLNLIDQHMVAV